MLDNKFSVTAVIVAAGIGTRMGGVSKPLIELGGITVIERVLNAFAAAETVDEIIVVCRTTPQIASIVERCAKKTTIVKGGASRGDSVKNGILAAKADFVCVHDCARPFITPEDIDKVNRASLVTGAASASSRVYNTTKYIDGEFGLSYTPDRDKLVSVQTPQTFKRDILLAAIARSEERRIRTTDETTKVELLGFKVEYVETGSYNFKLTDVSDLKKAQAILFLESRGIK